jgi:hypothetical protein
MKSFYKPGSWNVICDLCGFKFKSDQLKMRWDGAMVCSEDWEPRHPADLIKIPKENTSVPWVRPDPEPVYEYVCYIWYSMCYADSSQADCAQADTQTISYSEVVAFTNGDS